MMIPIISPPSKFGEGGVGGCRVGPFIQGVPGGMCETSGECSLC